MYCTTPLRPSLCAVRNRAANSERDISLDESLNRLAVGWRGQSADGKSLDDFLGYSYSHLGSFLERRHAFREGADVLSLPEICFSFHALHAKL